MASGRLVNGNWMPAVDSDGYPIPDAYIRVYTNMTSTLATIYANEPLTVPLENPVYANSSGQFPPIWQDSALLFSLEFGSTSLGPLGTVDDLAPSSNIGGAADKLDRDGGNPEPGFLTNVGAAATDLSNATIPLIDTYQPPAVVYHRKRALVISDMASYEDDPDAPNDAAWAETLSDATDQYASGEISVVDTFRLAGTVVGPQRVGFTVPQDVKVVSGDNMDFSFNVSRLWSGKKAAIVCADNVSQGVVASEGSKLVGLNILKECVSTPPNSVTDFFDRLDLFFGDGITANSLPGFEAHDLTVVGFNRTGVILGCERFNMSRIKADCLSGLEVLTLLDVGYLTQISQWPLFAAGWWRNYLGLDPQAPGTPEQLAYDNKRRLYDWSISRPGTALKASLFGGAGVDGLIVNGFGSFGYNVKGLHAVSLNASMFQNMWIDHVYGSQATVAQAAAYAGLANDAARTAVRTATMDAALVDAGGGTSGYSYSTYNVHPRQGIIQSLGIATEGDCQNTQFSVCHVDSNAKNYAFLHGGQIGIIGSSLTSGQARIAQFELGDNRGRLTNIQYAGGADDAAITVGAGVQDWEIRGANGDEAGVTAGGVFTPSAPIRYGNAATAKNVRITNWTHSQGTVGTAVPVIQSTLVRATPTGNPAPTTGSFQPVVMATEAEDRLAEYNTASGTYTAKYPGTVDTKAWIVFSPSAATGGQHALRLKQNGTTIKTQFIRSESTAQYSVSLDLEVMCNPGDTLTYEVFHEVAATWSGAECGIQLRNSGQF